MYIINHIYEIMHGMSREEGVVCDFNHALALYQRGTHWED
jgi:hypothetical protein